MVIRRGFAIAFAATKTFASRAPLVLAAIVVLSALAAPAQSNSPPNAPNAPPVKERFLVGRFPDKPSLSPALTLPVDSLGFSAPGAIYLGSRNALASLDFLDENHLLFTFRIPSLLHRDLANSDSTYERQVRAVVLSLPDGALQAQATWTLHDRVRYLWPLKNGRFLLRDGNKLFDGDASLALKPYLDFPGPLLSISLDPEQQFLVTNSREPVGKPAKPDAVTSPSTASASITSDQDSAAGEGDHPDLVVRILRRDSGQVMLVSRVRSQVHLPINSEGYLEFLRSRGTTWMLNLTYFTGGSKMLGSVDSTCEPDGDFLSEHEVLVTACGPSGETNLVAMTTGGRTLWKSQAPSTEVWPQLIVAGNGSRLAWETLDTNHSIYSWAPMDAGDVKEQSVTVFDAADGDIALVAPIGPILDVGGNVALSPSGRRVALIDAGAIQVFDLPAPPPLPAAP